MGKPAFDYRSLSVHEPGPGLVRRFRESGLFADTAEWWVAGPRDVLPFAESWRGIDGIDVSEVIIHRRSPW